MKDLPGDRLPPPRRRPIFDALPLRYLSAAASSDLPSRGRHDEQTASLVLCRRNRGYGVEPFGAGAGVAGASAAGAGVAGASVVSCAASGATVLSLRPTTMSPTVR